MVVIEEQLETKLKEWGTSRGVRIPKSICEYMLIEVGSELTMSAGQDDAGYFITLRPASSEHRSFSDAPAMSMDDAFFGYAGSYMPTEADWGADVGAEVIA